MYEIIITKCQLKPTLNRAKSTISSTYSDHCNLHHYEEKAILMTHKIPKLNSLNAGAKLQSFSLVPLFLHKNPFSCTS